ncbi:MULTISPECIES: sulfate transporter CysZ [unclassified Oceanobacter]|uniref:sulfate transporter CysZ n=1 Tax=unclassified Oceanobacter TaxID=2620260 RepID=UPI002736440F|nr:MULTISPECIES: sulfate transporter CysZ [unclassified Oceanobacter]MDP2506885.1 sulfate transporter CysZ [Oceanobacter sp. 3_MG-2023]MDP2608438.1 sulfate transporter CysZ [Oceanobacter sp. 1_MG-2023]MDP2611533.1 sulfate transporter CysZ [Oceanobacter sp. 2_MG-2023]
MKDNLLIGAGYLWRGFTLLNEPGIRRYVWLPILINLLVLSFGTYWLIDAVSQWDGFDSSWISWLAWLVVPLLLLLSTLISGYFFSAVLLLLASPFYGLLAGKIEQRLGHEVEDESIAALIPRTVIRELVKMGYYLPRYLLLLLLSFVPGVNLLMPFVWFWFGSWVMALQYSDYTLDNQQQNFRASREQVATQRWTAWGFGGAVSVLMAVPLLNCLVPPAAVIGATLWQLQRQADQSRAG